MVRGGPTPRQPVPRGDHAVSDFVGTLLMVGIVVALGSVVAVLATSTLEEPAPSTTSLALAPAGPGDASLRLLLRNGEAIPLHALSVSLQRGDADAADVPAASWTTPDPSSWRPGDRLSLPLSPPAAPDERLRVRVFRADENVLVAELATRVPAATLAPSATTLAATFSPMPLITDGISTTLLAVRATHPEGVLGVASVVADLRNVTVPYGSAPLVVELNDAGRSGDLVGGDGIWSAHVALPPSTPPGTYTVSVNATDAAGRVASVPATLGTVSKALGTEGTSTSIGTSFAAPTSENVTSFRLKGWNWDRLYPQRLDDDFVLVRVLGDDGRSWSALVLLEEANGQPYAKQLRVWGPLNETFYAPRNGTRLSLVDLDMDILDPVASQQWVYASGAPHPTALYPSSGVLGSSRFVAAHFGQDQTTSNAQLSLNSGIFSVEVVLK